MVSRIRITTNLVRFAIIAKISQTKEPNPEMIIWRNAHFEWTNNFLFLLKNSGGEYTWTIWTIWKLDWIGRENTLMICSIWTWTQNIWVFEPEPKSTWILNSEQFGNWMNLNANDFKFWRLKN